MKRHSMNYKDILKAEFSDLYFIVGAGLQASQSFELTLKFILYSLSILKLVDFDSNKAETIINGKLKQTSGQLLNILKGIVSFSEDEEAILQEALDARNYLIHNYFIENLNRLPIKREREKMVKEVEELGAKIWAGDKVFQRAIEVLTPLYENGKTYDQIAYEVVQKFK